MKPPVPLHALLIGIDRYAPESRHFRPLRGAVADVRRMEGFLRERWEVPGERIEVLVAPRDAEEPPEQTPTHANMVAAFRRLQDRARPGEQVWIHYSGHGARVKTAYPEAKGRRGYDEALVPVDIDDPDATYLRDLELARLLAELVEANLSVTVVLDSCHSGGATRRAREEGPRARGALGIACPRPVSNAVAPREDLLPFWDWLRGPDLGQASRASGARWLPEPRGYVLLAASQERELAFEDLYDDRRPGGALTHFLLETLATEPDPGSLTYRDLFARIAPEVQSAIRDRSGGFKAQNPQLEGDADRCLLGGDRLAGRPVVRLVEVERSGERILLDAGEMHATRPRDRFTLGADRPGDRLADVEVETVDTTTSWARILRRSEGAVLTPGMTAWPIRRGADGHARPVRLRLPEELDGRLQEVLPRQSAGLVVVLPEDDPVTPAADFEVRLEDGAYVLADGAGRSWPNLAPIPVDRDEAENRVARRLGHLARFSDVRELGDDIAEGSPLAGALELTLHDVPTPGSGSAFGKIIAGPGDRGVRAGETAVLRVRNVGSSALHIVVLVLSGADYSIERIYPGQGSDARSLDAGAEVAVPLVLTVGEGREEEKDVLKILGSLEPFRTESLKLEPIDTSPLRGSRHGGWNWTAAELLLRVVGGGGS